ncbi:MAG: hypothetical protein B7X11_03840 [Acidobacteria bacterium 37-65-4]|nr:MAG: hypothetical protein B7X11_03840 [Acidobacteria bacterium 37-65-4]
MDDKTREPLKVLDRRKFTADGVRRAGVEITTPDLPPKPAQEPAPDAAGQPADAKAGAGPVPQLSQAFALLVQELAQSCAISLGVPDPVSGRTNVDLRAANLYIDFLEALQEKTRGNLAPQEKQILEQDLSRERRPVLSVAALPGWNLPSFRCR